MLQLQLTGDALSARMKRDEVCATAGSPSSGGRTQLPTAGQASSGITRIALLRTLEFQGGEPLGSLLLTMHVRF